jgi:hypothetical protein
MLLGYDLQNMKAIESPEFLFQLHIHVRTKLSAALLPTEKVDLMERRGN